MEKIGISQLNAEFPPCSLERPYAERGILTLVQRTISGHRGSQASSDEPPRLL